MSKKNKVSRKEIEASLSSKSALFEHQFFHDFLRNSVFILVKSKKNVGTFQQIFLFISIIFNLKTSTNGGQVSQNLSNLADDCFFTMLNKEKSYCINTYMSLLKVMKLLKYYFLGEEKG